MLTLKTINSRAKTCQKCRGSFEVIYPMDITIQEKLLELNTARQPIKFIKVLLQTTNCGARDAKGTCMHYIKKVGECHYCKSEIKIAAFVDCPKCKSLNIAPFSSDSNL